AEKGCGALKSLAYDDENHLVMMKASAIDRVADVLKAFGEKYVGVAENGVGVLQNLATNSHNRKALKQAGILDLVAKLQAKHKGSKVLSDASDKIAEFLKRD